MLLHVNMGRVGLYCVTCDFWPSVHYKACRPHCLSTFWWATRTHYLHLALRHLATARTITTSLYKNPLKAAALIAFGTGGNTLRAFQTFLPFWLCRAAPFPRPPPLKVFGFHRCRNVFRETFISEQPVTRDCTGGHFTGLVRENRKRELHCKRMTFTCIFTFIHSCWRMEATPSGRAGGLERSQPGACIMTLLA